MNLPRIVTNPALQLLASPDETHEVHVIIRRIANQAPYTLRGRKRQYIVTRCQKRNAHILKVPLSLWMHGCNESKPVAENDSICYDIQGTRTGLKSPLTFEIWPVGAKTEEAITQAIGEALVDGALAYVTGKTPAANPFTVDKEEALNAAWLNGFDTAEHLSPTPQAINIAPPPPPAAPRPTATPSAAAPLSNRERQAAYRARKREEREAAKLQPA